MNRTLIFAMLLAAAASATPARAVTRLWPSTAGPTPCPSTLQACIDASAAGDVVTIGADEVVFPDATTMIDESVTITRSLTLTAAPGIDPVFAAGRNVSVATSGTAAATVNLSRLTLLRGRVLAVHGSTGASTFNFSGLRVHDYDGAFGSCLIEYASAPGAGSAQVIVGDNVLTTNPAGVAAPPNGICVGSAGPAVRTDIYRNRIEVASARLLRAISVTGSGITQAFIGTNVVRGRGFAAGITVNVQGATTPRRTIDIRDNLVRGQNGGPASSEAALAVSGQSIALALVNNTAIDNAKGIFLTGAASGPASGDVTGRVANNIVAYNRDYGMVIDSVGVAAVVNAYNLVFGNGADAYTPGMQTMTADPAFASRLTGALSLASPAINSGNNADLPVFVGFDAVGAKRLVSGVVDRGALEFTDDRTAVHVATTQTTAFNTSELRELGPLGLGEDIVVTPFDDEANDLTQNLGVYLSDGAAARWSVFLQDPTVNLTVGRRFTAMAPFSGHAHFRHVSTAGNTFDEYTRLDHPELDSRPFAIAVATGRYETPTGAAYHDHPIGLAYFSNRWYVRNHDLASMQFDHAFSVVIAPLGAPGAFTVVAPGPRSALALRHPYLDDNPCAAPMVGRTTSPDGGPQPANAAAFALQYEVGWDGAPGRWLVRAVGAGSPTFPANAAFAVIVDGNQAIGCNAATFADDVVFRNGYE